MKYQIKGGEVEIDGEDFGKVSCHKWYLSRGYAISKIDGKNRKMHKILLDIPNDLEVDHINRNRLDNRKTNLRLVTRQQNMQNKSFYKTNNTGITGVVKAADCDRWIAQIKYKGKRIYLGVFETRLDAAKARIKAGHKYGIRTNIDWTRFGHPEYQTIEDQYFS